MSLCGNGAGTGRNSALSIPLITQRSSTDAPRLIDSRFDDTSPQQGTELRRCVLLHRWQRVRVDVVRDVGLCASRYATTCTRAKVALVVGGRVTQISRPFVCSSDILAAREAFPFQARRGVPWPSARGRSIRDLSVQGSKIVLPTSGGRSRPGGRHHRMKLGRCCVKSPCSCVIRHACFRYPGDRPGAKSGHLAHELDRWEDGGAAG